LGIIPFLFPSLEDKSKEDIGIAFAIIGAIAIICNYCGNVMPIWHKNNRAEKKKKERVSGNPSD
jgi:hypothetical protein